MTPFTQHLSAKKEPTLNNGPLLRIHPNILQWLQQIYTAHANPPKPDDPLQYTPQQIAMIRMQYQQKNPPASSKYGPTV